MISLQFVSDSLPNAKSATKLNEREKLHRLIERRGLCGLANDTKWDELIVAMSDYPVRSPAYRWKCVDGVPVGWETEWLYHPPFPMISVEWMDLLFCHDPLRPGMSWSRYLGDDATNHSDSIAAIVQRIGFDYVKGAHMLRIFGYSPKDMALFDDEPKDSSLHPSV